MPGVSTREAKAGWSEVTGQPSWPGHSETTSSGLEQAIVPNITSVPHAVYNLYFTVTSINVYQS